MPSALFPGNSNYRLDLTTSVSGTTISATIGVTKTAGYGYWTANAQWWRIRISGVDQDGSWTYDFRGGTPKSIGIATRSRNVGNGTFTVETWVNMDSGIGQAYTSQTVAIAGVPSAPGSLKWRASAQSNCNLGLEYTRGSNNGSALVQDQVQWSTTSNFSNVVWTDGGAAGYSSPNCGAVSGAPALQPGTTYYVRARSRNGVGWGPWSSTLSGTTLPATAPGISITPSSAGTSATVTITPPSGTSGVSNYTLERRPVGGSTTTTTVSGTSTISGLTPGTIYQWRVRANYSSGYQSPFSGWVSVTQPNPNTTAGDYYDGSTTPASGSGMSYSWTGTAGLSTSRVSGPRPLGWAAFNAPTAIVHRARGGYVGSYAARVLFITDGGSAMRGIQTENSAAGRASVQDGVTYFGSIYARPSKGIILRAHISWINSAGSIISTQYGVEQTIPDGRWTRLTVSGVAPNGAVYAIVGVADYYDPWRGGDFLDADAAMLTLGGIFPYFDGSTRDSAAYRYEWLGDENASASIRYTLEGKGEEDPLSDPDCDPIPAAPSPPQIPVDCIIEVGEWRRYTVEVPAAEIRRWSTTVPTVILKTGASDERQVRIRFYQNDDGVPASEADFSEWDAELIITYIPPDTEITIDSISRRVWANVSGRGARPAAQLVYGTGGAPATWPEFACGSGQFITLDVPTTAPSGNLSTRILLTQRS